MAASLLKKHALIQPAFSGAGRGDTFAAAVQTAIEAVLAAEWSNAKRFREGLDFAKEAVRFLGHLGHKLAGAEAIAARANAMADAADQPSPAVIVGLKTLANLLLGKVPTPGGKGKKKREREAGADANAGEGAEGASAKKTKKGKADRLKKK